MWRGEIEEGGEEGRGQEILVKARPWSIPGR